MPNNALLDEPRADGEARAGEVTAAAATRLDDDAGALTLANLPDATLEAVLDAREATLKERKPMGPPIPGEDESGNEITLSKQPSNSDDASAIDDDDDNGAVEITPVQEQVDSSTTNTQPDHTDDSDDEDSPEVTPTGQQ